MTDLKPCPFCGGVAKSVARMDGNHIECVYRHDTCPMNARTHRHMDYQKCVAEWNTRTPDIDWQPIETAPREGRFLVCDTTHEHSEDIPGSIDVAWREEGSFFVDVYNADGDFHLLEYAETATHWAPLPAPPTGTP